MQLHALSLHVSPSSTTSALLKCCHYPVRIFNRIFRQRTIDIASTQRTDCLNQNLKSMITKSINFLVDFPTNNLQSSAPANPIAANQPQADFNAAFFCSLIPSIAPSRARAHHRATSAISNHAASDFLLPFIVIVIPAAITALCVITILLL